MHIMHGFLKEDGAAKKMTLLSQLTACGFSEAVSTAEQTQNPFWQWRPHLIDLEVWFCSPT